MEKQYHSGKALEDIVKQNGDMSWFRAYSNEIKKMMVFDEEKIKAYIPGSAMYQQYERLIADDKAIIEVIKKYI